jgi:hypothetical protein
MGVVIGTYEDQGPGGWSVFTNPFSIIYCSSTDGLDSNNGTSPLTPVQTPGAAYAKAAALGNSKAHWILFKRGDIFDNQYFAPTSSKFSLQGDVTNQNPLVVSNYDPDIPVNGTTGAGVNPAASLLARPQIRPPVEFAFAAMFGGTENAGGRWTAWVGLDCYRAHADPTNVAEYGPQLLNITVANPGSGWVPGNRITLTASNGTTIHPSDYTTLLGVNGNCPQVLTTRVSNLPTINAAGSGGGNDGSGAIFQGTTGTGTRFRVSCTVSGGAVASIDSLTLAGSYSANPSLTAAPMTLFTTVSGAGAGTGGVVRLTVASVVGMASGNSVTVAGVLGTTEANGTFVVTVVDVTHIDLAGTTFVHAYTSSGTVTGGGPTGATAKDITMGANTIYCHSGRYANADRPTAFTVTATNGAGTGLTVINPQYSDLSSTYLKGFIAQLNPLDWMLIEDCKWTYNLNAVDFIVSAYAVGSITPHSSNVILQRNQAAFDYGQGVHGGGIYPWILSENFIYHNGYVGAGPTTNFNHNIYTDGQARKGDPNSAPGPISLRGNFFSKGSESSQIRSGGFIEDNVLCEEQTAFACLFPTNSAYYQRNNVYTEGRSAAVGVAIGMSTMQTSHLYGGGILNLGMLEISGDIVANSLSTTGSGYRLSQGCNGAHVHDIKYYKWAPSSPTSAIVKTAGALKALTITTPGSGYDPKGRSVTGITRENGQSGVYGYNTNNVALICDTSLMNAGLLDGGGGYVWIEGIVDTGNIGSTLNGKLWACQKSLDKQKLVIYGTSALNGTWQSGGTVHAPHLHVVTVGTTTTVTSCALTTVSGPGSGGRAEFFVNNAGQVVAANIYGSEGDIGPSYNAANFGSGYSADPLNPSIVTSSELSGGGSGFQATVTEVCVNTVDDATNVIIPTDPTGSLALAQGWPDAGRTVARWARLKGIALAGDSDDTSRQKFYDYVLAHQAKNTWNPDLTAWAIRQWIQEGFGGAGIPAPTPPVLHLRYHKAA